VPAGRRTAVVALPDGGRWVHSPVPGIDDVRHAVAPSAIHGHLDLGAYPEARLWGGPGLARRRRDLRFAGELGDEPVWPDVFDQALIPQLPAGGEVVFCHRASGTLIVGDAVWNVTPDQSLRSRVWAGGLGVHPTPLFRLALRGARAAIDRILSWDFDRIVVGHGPNIETGGREVFARAYRFLYH
jgi:hypothetical protein